MHTSPPVYTPDFEQLAEFKKEKSKILDDKALVVALLTGKELKFTQMLVLFPSD